MPKKPLVIDTKESPNGIQDKWESLDNVGKFIENIITPEIAKGTNIGTLVSGIPTAFARVDLFHEAIRAEAAGNSDANKGLNLHSFYSQLVDEWKGLISCIALDYQNISAKTIDLAYSDGKGIKETQNLYEPKGAFGNVLLERRRLWSDLSMGENQNSIPRITIIKYKGRVVGATSPETLLFTSTAYELPTDDSYPWVSQVNIIGKYIDPLKSELTQDQTATLHAYVSRIIDQIDDFKNYYAVLEESLRPEYTSITTVLEKWKEDIKTYADSRNYILSIGSTPPVQASFCKPFDQLFNYKEILHGAEGEISTNAKQGAIEFDPRDLLLDDSARIAKLDLNVKPNELKDLPILVLSADVKGVKDKAYFALPLSAQGLNVFGKNVAALVGMAESSAIKSSLVAQYDPSLNEGNLEVVLTLITDSGIHRKFNKIYTCDNSIDNSDILIWPNFVSPQWDAYFMYNELPHNGTSQTYRAFPFVGEMEENYFRIIVDESKHPVLLSKDGKISAPESVVKSDLLVKCDEAVADNPYKYEIYRSNKPFKGVRLLSPTGVEGGYLLINYSSAQGSTLPHDWMRPGAHSSLKPVRLGIDFGSTNTSIAYSSDGTGEQGFVFTNQRVSLMGNELPGHPIFPRENQVFFFQGAGSNVKSNAIKSVLTLHDNRRLPDLHTGETIKMRNEREVVGGFPCFTDNLPFSNSDKNKITLFYPDGVGEVTQIHNMKWEDNDDDKAHKSAFLRTLMLQVYATLFAQGYVPESLKWSYPSAMAGQLLYSYQSIWQTLKSVSPVLNENGVRYSLNVSNYTDSRSFGKEIGSGPFRSGNQDSEDGGFGCFGGGFVSSSGGFGSSCDGFGGGFGDSDSGFGSSNGSAFGAGFGSFQSESQTHPDEMSVPDSANDEEFMPDDPEREMKYNPEPLYTVQSAGNNPSLSEAEAVANFISARYGKETNVLNLCFDVGGSTTDISALFFLKGNITMIKQNSLRFAAQRVSQSVSAFPEFRNVLIGICAKYKIKMVGLNFGNDSYNEATAPYFFDQIVNRLSDDQLEDLYRAIAADCPLLMCVNLYVTGLLMFYAGQIAHKLIDDLNRTNESEWEARRKPNVRISFAGKGSRLFQWLSTINPKAANQYYGQLFVMGYGEQHLRNTLAGWQKIELPKLNDHDIKFEVCKGLAKGDTILQRPSIDHSSEIIGENGFELTGKDNVRRPLDFTNSITPRMLESIGVRLCVETNSSQADKFTEFCSFFYGAARQLFGWNVKAEELKRACRDMNITAYVQNMPEFRSAATEANSGGKPFSFVAPIIILEGMKFYDNILLKFLK